MNKTYRESKKNKKAYTKDELYRKDEINRLIICLYALCEVYFYFKNSFLILSVEFLTETLKKLTQLT